MSHSRSQLNECLRKINITGKRCIDLGVQDKPTSRLTTGNPFEYVTMDIDAQWKPKIIGDLNKPISTWRMGRRRGHTYDVVFCIETLEHIWNPLQALLNITTLLRKDGRAYISAPFINPIHDTHDMLRYTDEWFETVLPHYDLKVVRIETRTAEPGLDSLIEFFKLEGMRMSKIRLKQGDSWKLATVGYFVEAKKL